MDEHIVCFNIDCLYKDTCKRWLDNHCDLHEDDGDDKGYRAEWGEWKRDRCHVPMDGKLL